MAFPTLTPTARSFSPATYPQKTYRALSGLAVKRTFGTQPTGATLELQYDNITDANVVTLIDHYRSETSANRRFLLSTNVTAGMSDTLAARTAATLDNLRWEYAEPPQVQSVRPGRSNVRIALIGEIRNPQRDE